MPKHVYAVNAVLDFPINGSFGRATRHGHIETAIPATADGLKGAIARDAAERFGIEPGQVTFAEFTFTEIPTA